MFRSTKYSESRDRDDAEGSPGLISGFRVTSGCRRRLTMHGCIHILRLPYELLAEIFLLVLEPPTEDRPVAACVDSILALSQVCAHWRRVAHNTPRLWLLASFPIFASGPETTRMAFTATEMFLRRSAPLPVSIVYPPASESHLFNLKSIPQTMDALSHVAHRWKNFIWESEMAAAEVDILMRIPSGRLDNLERLAMKLSNRGKWDRPTVFSSTPRLRDVTIFMSDATSDILPMPWAQLAQLSLRSAPPQLCLDVLVRCLNVVSVSLDARRWQDRDLPVMSEPICLAHLEHLDIRITPSPSGESFAPFLQCLRLPTLKSLSLWMPIDRHPGWFISPFILDLISFLRRSPDLDILATDCIWAEEMPGVLQHTPSLTTLSFEGEIDDNFLATLHYSETDSVPLVPKLERLYLEDASWRDYEESSLLNILRSRWWSDDELLAMPPPAVARLKCVELWMRSANEPEKTPEFYETVDLYRGQGLELLGDGFD
jgi:hypothetical protein